MNIRVSQAKVERYQEMTNFLLFLMIKTLPDMIFAILITSCFTHNFSSQYAKVMKAILRYLKPL